LQQEERAESAKSGAGFGTDPWQTEKRTAHAVARAAQGESIGKSWIADENAIGSVSPISLRCPKSIIHPIAPFGQGAATGLRHAVFAKAHIKNRITEKQG